MTNIVLEIESGLAVSRLSSGSFHCGYFELRHA